MVYQNVITIGFAIRTVFTIEQTSPLLSSSSSSSSSTSIDTKQEEKKGKNPFDSISEWSEIYVENENVYVRTNKHKS
jgi:hypothetical protein